jgi:hypothetical protein
MAGAAIADDLTDRRSLALRVRLAGGVQQGRRELDDHDRHSGPRTPVAAELVELCVGGHSVLIPAVELVVLLERRAEWGFADRAAGRGAGAAGALLRIQLARQFVGYAEADATGRRRTRTLSRPLPGSQVGRWPQAVDQQRDGHGLDGK